MARTLQVIQQARRCTECAGVLPLGPRPLVAASATSRIVIIGQAPGIAAHQSGIPWNDRSGDRLREWLGVTREQFHDVHKVALLPMGFCYPGSGKSGDLAPRPECAPLWHERILTRMESVGLTVLVGRYAFDRYLGGGYGSVTEAVRSYAALLPSCIALPHPSPRNNIWLKKNPWFQAEVLPALRIRVRAQMR